MQDTFTEEVYKKARGVVQSQKFEKAWQEYLDKEVKPTSLLAADGPAEAHATGPDKLRQKLKADKRKNEDILVEAAQNGASAGKWQERAATLKMLKHFYRARKRGGQDVWVYSPPMKYHKWIYEEVDGNEDTVKQKLRDESEVYTDADKGRMCDALQLALKSCEKAKAKIPAAKGDKRTAEGDATRKLIQRWFADQDTTDADIDKFIPDLLAGFKKMASLCNSTTLVFMSVPSYRADEDKFKRTRGSVIRGGEGPFPVIALEGAFKEMGNSGQIWKCAKTIVHEASHHEVKTRDLGRDGTGLKPDKTRFPHAKAIDNADSWGYFAIDLNGLLSEADRREVLKDWE